MRAKQGHKLTKPDSPYMGRWLKRYWAKRTCRRHSPVPPNRVFYVKTRYVFLGKGDPIPWIGEEAEA